MGEIGARKVALFLSLLEPSTVETLMGLFDPDVARKVAEEARKINPEDLYYDESLISDFLDAFGEDMLGAETTRLLADEARRNAERYELSAEPAPEDAETLRGGLRKDDLEAVFQDDFDEDFEDDWAADFGADVEPALQTAPAQAPSAKSEDDSQGVSEEDRDEFASELERVDTGLLNAALQGERNALRAVVATRLSPRKRRELTEKWTREERELTRLYAEAIEGGSEDAEEGARRLEDVLFERAFDYE